MSTLNELVLTVVRVVCREHPAVGSLPHVVHLLQEYVYPDPSSALHNAVELRNTHLVNMALHILDQSPHLIHYEKLQKYREAMHLIPAKFTTEQGALTIMQELYARHPLAMDPETVNAVCTRGDLPMLQWLYPFEHTKIEENKMEIFHHACRSGRDNVVHWILKLFPDLKCDLVYAAEGDQPELVKWLIEHSHWNASSVGEAVEAAFKNGNLALAQSLHGRSATPYSVRVYLFPESGQIELLQWLLDTKCGESWDDLVFHAARRGRLDVIKWLHERKMSGFTTTTMDTAAINGHLEVVKWLHIKRQGGCSSQAMDYSAGAGHLEIVQWLHRNRLEGCTTIAMDSAAANGHLHVLEWLHANRCEGFTKQATIAALKNNRLGVLKWLHEHQGIKGTKGSIDVAAKNGNLEMVKWLHVNGNEFFGSNRFYTLSLQDRFVCSTQAMDRAAANGHLQVLKFLHENRSDGCTEAAMLGAARGNHLEVVKWLHVNYPEMRYKTSTLNEAMTGAAERGHVDVMKFLHMAFQKEWSDKAMKAAVKNGKLEAVKWLYVEVKQPLYPGCEFDAARADNVGLLEFIRLNSDHCNNSDIYSTSWDAGLIEVGLWYKDHFGNPHKRQRS